MKNSVTYCAPDTFHAIFVDINSESISFYAKGEEIEFFEIFYRSILSWKADEKGSSDDARTCRPFLISSLKQALQESR